MGSSVILPAAGQPVEGPDPQFKTGSIPSAVTFQFSAIGPPPSLYVQQDDTLQVNAVSSLATDTVTFRVRFLHVALPVPGQPDQLGAEQKPVTTPIPPYIGLYEFSVVTTTPRVAVAQQFKLGEGFVLSIDAVALNALTRGVTFARAEIFRGLATAQQFAQLFISDYVDINASTSYPGSTIHHYLEGPGQLHSLQVTNPAAGADWTLTCANKQRLRIDSFAAVFVASATVASRNIQIIVDDGANLMWADDTPTTVAAGATVNLTVTQTNIPTGVVASILHCVIPPALALASGWRLRSSTQNIQVGDQWSNIFFNVEEWLDF